MIRRADLQYQTPPGYYDDHFIYVYDADALMVGIDYENLVIPISDADFILRKLDGMQSVLGSGLAGSIGRYQVRDAVRGNFFYNPIYPIGALSIFSPSSRAVLPERKYPLQGEIGFDLYNILQTTKVAGITPATVLYMCQMLFWGVKRKPGARKESSYKYRLVPFSYSLSVTIDWDAYVYNIGGIPLALANMKTFTIPVQNNDFELWGLNVCNPATGLAGDAKSKMILYDQTGTARVSHPILTDLFATNSNTFPGAPPGWDWASQGNVVSPPILYQVGSQIKFDIQSMCLALLGEVPTVREYTFFGAQRVPVRG
jgi:hypothetical protein